MRDESGPRMMTLGTVILRPSATRVPVDGSTGRAVPDPSSAESSEIFTTSVLSNPPRTNESRGTPSHSAVTRTLLEFEGEMATTYRTEGVVAQPVRSAARRRNEAGKRRERARMGLEINAADWRCHPSAAGPLV